MMSNQEINDKISNSDIKSNTFFDDGIKDIPVIQSVMDSKSKGYGEI